MVRSRRWESIAIVVVVAILLVAAARWFGGGTSSIESPATSAVPISAEACAPAFDDGTVAVDELPEQALVVLEQIAEGGPFGYEQDGRTFQNRERHLPSRERGYYEEFTVPTPGSQDRSARRIVAGDCGERYYTDDHYDSFDLIVE